MALHPFVSFPLMKVLTGAEAANRPVVGKLLAFRLGHTPPEPWAGVETRLTDDDSQKIFRSSLSQAAQESVPGMLDDGTATRSFHTAVIRWRGGMLYRGRSKRGVLRGLDVRSASWGWTGGSLSPPRFPTPCSSAKKSLFGR